MICLVDALAGTPVPVGAQPLVDDDACVVVVAPPVWPRFAVVVFPGEGFSVVVVEDAGDVEEVLLAEQALSNETPRKSVIGTAVQEKRLIRIPYR